MRKTLSTFLFLILIPCLILFTTVISCSEGESQEEEISVTQESIDTNNEAMKTGGEMTVNSQENGEKAVNETGKNQAKRTEAAKENSKTGTQIAQAVDKGDPVNGKKLYNQVCGSCHGESGKGDGPASVALVPKPRDHTDTEYMSSISNEHIFKVVKEGGVSVGLSSLMPAWGDTLSDDEIWDVIAYIRIGLCNCEYKGE